MIIHRWTDIDPRCNKIIKFLLEEKFQVIFIGIKTKEALIDEELYKKYATQYTRILYRQNSNSRLNVLINILPFYFFLIKNIIKFRPEFLHCVNEEIGLITYIFKSKFFKFMILDIFDSLYLRVKIKNKAIKRLLYFFVNLVYSNANEIIVTDDKRKELIDEKYKNKVSVIYNSPDMKPFNNIYLKENKVFKICVMGSIARSKGILQLLEAIKDLENVEIIAFGNLFDVVAKKQFFNSPKVKYLGSFNNMKSMQLAARTDVIYAFYEPNSVNNIYASPNKLFEAMCIGKPILINSEAKMSNIVENYKIGRTCSYYDVKALRGIIIQLTKLKESEKKQIAKTSQSLFLNNYSWEKSKIVLKKIYNKERKNNEYNFN